MPTITYTGPVGTRVVTVDGKTLTFTRDEPADVTAKQADRILDTCPTEFVAKATATTPTQEN